MGCRSSGSLLRRLGPGIPEMTFGEVRYRSSSGNRLEWCLEGRAGRDRANRRTRTTAGSASRWRGRSRQSGGSEASVELSSGFCSGHNGYRSTVAWAPSRSHARVDRSRAPGTPAYRRRDRERGLRTRASTRSRGEYTLIHGCAAGIAIEPNGDGRFFLGPLHRAHEVGRRLVANELVPLQTAGKRRPLALHGRRHVTVQTRTELIEPADTHRDSRAYPPSQSSGAPRPGTRDGCWCQPRRRRAALRPSCYANRRGER